MGILTGIIAFIILLPIIVFVHEYGHFLFARINGVRVESFSIGFGPSLFEWKDKHNTVWKISAIPLGGYVKMLGQSDTPESAKEKAEKAKKLTAKEKAESFQFKKLYQKASIVFAGPFFNFVFGFILFFSLFFFKGIPNTTSIVMDVVKDSPAYSSGIKTGDIFVSINGTLVENPRSIGKIIKSSNGKKLDIVVNRSGKNIDISVIPEQKNDSYFLGVSYASKFENYKKIGFVKSIQESYSSIKNIVVDTVKSLGEILIGSRSSKELGGMISIAKVSGEALSSGFYSFLYLMSFISVSLGLFNLFPIPVLDGGYLFMYMIEGIIRREIPEKIKEVIFSIGFMFIIFLLLLSNFNDILRIVK
ncbi:MAG: RIP metalloprotease RseP [Alphaproteobacteria bacterium]|nr:RIP metalloprotease RseP [Alphaproteobacteria bacterium]